MQGSDCAPTGQHSQWARPGLRRAATTTRLAAAAVIGTALLLAAACSGSGPVTAAKPKPTPKPSPVTRVIITPVNGSTGVKPSKGIVVTAVHGKLTNVSVRTTGTQVTGTYRQGGTVWRSKWTLGTSQRFLVTATAQGPDGKTVIATSRFHTLSPKASFQTQIFEGSSQTYGVGMPIKLTFSEPITDKAAVEKALTLRTSKPVVGAWWWDGDQVLDFRPKRFWPIHTTVWFTGHLDGVEGAPGMYGIANLIQKFHVGDSLVAHVSTSLHRMKLFRNGKHIYTWPISSGKPGDDTPNGIFLTIDKGNPVEMKPADIKPGQPGYYDVKVAWSVRFTWSGDYIHSAPWSVAEQGNTNVSHGCVNLGPSYAPIYYKMAVPGDPVFVSGSPVHGKWDDGWTDWFLSWHQVLSYSATGKAVKAGPSGSRFVDPASLSAASASPSPAPPMPATPTAAASISATP